MELLKNHPGFYVNRDDFLLIKRSGEPVWGQYKTVSRRNGIGIPG